MSKLKSHLCPEIEPTDCQQSIHYVKDSFDRTQIDATTACIYNLDEKSCHLSLHSGERHEKSAYGESRAPGKHYYCVKSKRSGQNGTIYANLQRSMFFSNQLVTTMPSLGLLSPAIFR